MALSFLWISRNIESFENRLILFKVTKRDRNHVQELSTEKKNHLHHILCLPMSRFFKDREGIFGLKPKYSSFVVLYFRTATSYTSGKNNNINPKPKIKHKTQTLKNSNYIQCLASFIHSACLQRIRYALYLNESIQFSKTAWKLLLNYEMGTVTLSALLQHHWEEVREGAAFLNALSLFPTKFSPATTDFHL